MKELEFWENKEVICQLTLFRTYEVIVSTNMALAVHILFSY